MIIEYARGHYKQEVRRIEARGQRAGAMMDTPMVTKQMEDDQGKKDMEEHPVQEMHVVQEGKPPELNGNGTEKEPLPLIEGRGEGEGEGHQLNGHGEESEQKAQEPIEEKVQKQLLCDENMDVDTHDLKVKTQVKQEDKEVQETKHEDGEERDGEEGDEDEEEEPPSPPLTRQARSKNSKEGVPGVEAKPSDTEREEPRPSVPRKARSRTREKTSSTQLYTEVIKEIEAARKALELLAAENEKNNSAAYGNQQVIFPSSYGASSNRLSSKDTYGPYYMSESRFNISVLQQNGNASMKNTRSEKCQVPMPNICPDIMYIKQMNAYGYGCPTTIDPTEMLLHRKLQFKLKKNAMIKPDTFAKLLALRKKALEARNGKPKAKRSQAEKEAYRRQKREEKAEEKRKELIRLEQRVDKQKEKISTMREECKGVKMEHERTEEALQKIKAESKRKSEGMDRAEEEIRELHAKRQSLVRQLKRVASSNQHHQETPGSSSGRDRDSSSKFYPGDAGHTPKAPLQHKLQSWSKTPGSSEMEDGEVVPASHGTHARHTQETPTPPPPQPRRKRTSGWGPPLERQSLGSNYNGSNSNKELAAKAQRTPSSNNLYIPPPPPPHHHHLQGFSPRSKNAFGQPPPHLGMMQSGNSNNGNGAHSHQEHQGSAVNSNHNNDRKCMPKSPAKRSRKFVW